MRLFFYCFNSFVFVFSVCKWFATSHLQTEKTKTKKIEIIKKKSHWNNRQRRNVFLFLRSHFATTAFVQNTRLELTYQRYLTEVESSRKSLASRTHFEVPGIGLKGQAPSLEACKFLKMPCPQPRTALFFESLKMGHGHDFFYVILENARKLVKIFFFLTTSEILRKFFYFLRDYFFFGEHLRVVLRVARGGQGVCPPPIEMPQVKIMGQKGLVSSVSVFLGNFAFKSIHVYNNN